MPTAQVIRRLRELGMPLEDVKVVLQARDVATRNAAIVAHLQRMEDQLQRTQAVVASLRQLIEHAPTPVTVEYRAVGAVNTIAIREEVAYDDVPAWWTAAFTELRSALETLGARRVGADGALYSNALFEHERGEVVAFVPVQGRPEPIGRVKAILLPAGEFAVALHRGSFGSLDQTFGALGTFVAERAIGVAGPFRENYLVGALDTADEAQHRTEVCWPIFQTTTEAPPA